MPLLSTGPREALSFSPSKDPQYLGRSLAQFIYNDHNLLLQINTTEKKETKRQILTELEGSGNLGHSLNPGSALKTLRLYLGDLRSVFHPTFLEPKICHTSFQYSTLPPP